MRQNPLGSNGCCLPSVEGVTYLKIGAQGVTVGVMGLEKVFQQLWMMGRQPDEVNDTELVDMVRNYAYIPKQKSVEADYAVALRRAYAAFYARQEQKK